MRRGTIQGFAGSWGSGIATLTIREGDSTVAIPCENAPTVRALAAMFPDVIGDGHCVNVGALEGQEVQFCMDDMGLMLGGLAPMDTVATLPALAALGEEICAAGEDRGTQYADGGFDISDASESGAEMIDAGIGYVCPHMVACASCGDRAEHCSQCARGI